MTEHGRPSIGPILELCGRFQQFAALVAACRLRVFAALGDGEHPAEVVAARIGAPAHTTRQLLNALVALGLCKRTPSGYRNAPLAARFLDPASPAYVGDFVEWFGDGFAALATLDEAIRRGGPVGLSQSGSDLARLPPERLERYVRGMEQISVGTARYLAERVPLAGRRRLLDLGGGPAVFACTLARHHPELHVEVLELGPVVPFARRRVAAEGLADRVVVREADYKTADLGEGWDAVLLSQVLQTEAPEAGQALLRRVAAALAPGGLLIIHGVMTDEDGTSPPHVALMSLFLLALFPGGAAYPWTEVAAWVRAAGLHVDHFGRLPSPALTAIMLARK
ncbi:MAG: methyltransferase domain-containing protein [Chloroflexi bacterium]|nr:methyltransferase domain-containing protein [Chloroflexota bacterium]